MVRGQSWRWIWAGALMVAGLLTNGVRAEQIGVFFSAEGELKAVPRELPAGMDALTAARQALEAGPSSREQDQGLVSAFPAGTAIEQLRIERDRVGS